MSHKLAESGGSYSDLTDRRRESANIRPVDELHSREEFRAGNRHCRFAGDRYCRFAGDQYCRICMKLTAPLSNASPPQCFPSEISHSA